MNKKKLYNILNRIATTSKSEANEAIKIAINIMKKDSIDLKDIDLSQVYSKDIIFIQLLAEFAGDIIDVKEREKYIAEHIKLAYGNVKQDIPQQSEKTTHQIYYKILREVLRILKEHKRVRVADKNSDEHYKLKARKWDLKYIKGE